MGTLLIILIFGFIFYKIFSYMNRVRRFMNDPMSFFTGAGEASSRRRHQDEPAKRSKKFTGDVGEYVEFTDVACNTEDSAHAEVEYRVEEQVTDIEWVDIEEKK